MLPPKDRTEGSDREAGQRRTELGTRTSARFYLLHFFPLQTYLLGLTIEVCASLTAESMGKEQGHPPFFLLVFSVKATKPRSSPRILSFQYRTIFHDLLTHFPTLSEKILRPPAFFSLSLSLTLSRPSFLCSVVSCAPKIAIHTRHRPRLLFTQCFKHFIIIIAAFIQTHTCTYFLSVSRSLTFFPALSRDHFLYYTCTKSGTDGTATIVGKFRTLEAIKL
ncbi:unnamed protein product [Xylocopa violacea]|uniref:Uncharacterized protein n=1 Tax=Xylocopa violacea TaxID=135666 RepID=A0ABP1N7X3_XYLVO